jgi:hypothetical protein
MTIGTPYRRKSSAARLTLSSTAQQAKKQSTYMLR